MKSTRPKAARSSKDVSSLWEFSIISPPTDSCVTRSTISLVRGLTPGPAGQQLVWWMQREKRWKKAWVQRWQRLGRSWLLWRRRCSLRWMYCFSPEWSRKCVFRLLVLLKRLWHTWKEKHISCKTGCLSFSLKLQNHGNKILSSCFRRPLDQTSKSRDRRAARTWHSCGFSPVWTRWCFCRCASWVKLFLHRSHWKGRSPLCTRRWTFTYKENTAC
uniref:Uncharacterized protein n=1 Tax=Oryzias latipes TaxID=8090 RepID=A0A3P9MG21_ORYLA